MNITCSGEALVTIPPYLYTVLEPYQGGRLLHGQCVAEVKGFAPLLLDKSTQDSRSSSEHTGKYLSADAKQEHDGITKKLYLNLLSK